MSNATYSRNVDSLTPALMRRINLHKVTAGLSESALKVGEMLETDTPSAVLLHRLMENEQSLRANDPTTYEHFMYELASAQPDAMTQEELEQIVKDVMESIGTATESGDNV